MSMVSPSSSYAPLASKPTTRCLCSTGLVAEAFGFHHVGSSIFGVVGQVSEGVPLVVERHLLWDGAVNSA